MSLTKKAQHQPRIISTLFLTATVAFLLAIFVFLFPFQKKLEDLSIRSQGQVTHHAARSIQLAVSSLVAREWDSLVGFSTYVNTEDYDGMRVLTDAAMMASDGVTWAAVVDLDGTVLAGGLGVNEGTNVSTMAWFNQGLRRDTVQTVAARSATGEASIFISRPVRDRLGRVKGLAVYKLQGSWLEDFIQSSAERLDVDVTVLDNSAAPLFLREGDLDTHLSPLILSRAELGTNFESIVMKDGNRGSVSGVLPELIEGDMPDFGWSLVVQVPIAASIGTIGNVWTSMIWTAFFLFAAIGVLALVFALRYLKPLADLALEAAQIADGEEIYPSEATRSFEAEQLSNALARLQVRVQDTPKTSSR
ncbi:cache domain-containing protein [Maritimibacter dapengensis]|uniref:Cache domain-containing protein n=1 Tax=Maritimibacter dapengensis TaxID=2836868 RepID=A0ABS6T546_9RHOB|nr:cache domain-containing protein [Maritimibacter dapengensis]MBV7379666.1 cache domain-containing protein [Maritimibacter dapengensis]